MADSDTESERDYSKTSHGGRSKKIGRHTRTTKTGKKWKDQSAAQKQAYYRFKARQRYGGLSSEQKKALYSNRKAYLKMDAEAKAARKSGRKEGRVRKPRKKYKYADLSERAKLARKAYYEKYKTKFSERAKARRLAKKAAAAQPVVEAL